MVSRVRFLAPVASDSVASWVESELAPGVLSLASDFTHSLTSHMGLESDSSPVDERNKNASINSTLCAKAHLPFGLLPISMACSSVGPFPTPNTA